MDWITFSSVGGVMIAGAGFVVHQVQRIRKNDIEHLQREIRTEFQQLNGEVAHLAKTIEELKLADRCARREHQEIRREMMAEVSKIYQTLDQHKQWHLEQKG